MGVKVSKLDNFRALKTPIWIVLGL